MSAPLAATTPDALPVTADNFTRAETDTYFGLFVSRGAGGKFYHFRELAPIVGTGVRPNRDTLYSEAVFDLDAGPVTLTLPDAGSRFMSMLVIDEDHYALEVAYGAGDHTYTKQQVGTRYLFVALRTFVDPTSPHDLEQVHALQDAVKISQRSAGSFDFPQWDPVSQKTVRDALNVLNTTLPDMKRAFGRRDEVDPVRHLIGTGSAWGGNPEKDAIYLNVTPSQSDGQTIYRLAVTGAVPVDGFWSISVYNHDGYYVKNERDAYTLNNLTAKQDADGSITVQFGGCDGQAANCLPIFPDWNYMVRLYRPRPEIVNGTWTFPEAQPAG
ncbi:MAG TPA: DUF1254 domain-containing protein [Chloroflexota bacterium]|jgi:hypothetical protein